MRKVQGHVLQPMMEWVEGRIPDLGEHWTVRSRLEPDLAHETKKIEGELEKLAERAWRRQQGNRKKEYKGEEGFCWDTTHLKKGWDAEMRERPGCVSSKRIKELRRELAGFVRTPLDKCPGEGMIVCGLKWREAVLELGADMIELTAKQSEERSDLIGRLAGELEELPFTNLRRGERHRFGAIKGWVKMKTFANGYPTEWAQVKWRPISSYARHRWGKLLGMAGKWATHCIRTLGWGYSVEDPREVLETIHSFNVRSEAQARVAKRKRLSAAEAVFAPRRKGKILRPQQRPGVMRVESEDLQRMDGRTRVHVRDIDHFFPSVNQEDVKEAIHTALVETWQQTPDAKYF